MRGVPFTLWVINVSEEVDTLVKEGRHGDAAQVARAAQDFARATELYEGIWQFADAAACAELDGDFPRALSNALEARDRESAARYAEVLHAQGDEGKAQALTVFAARRHFAKAALLAEELEKFDDAISYYQQGHLDLDAARLMIAADRKREAGKLLERVVKNLDAGALRSQANLQLGLLLSELMQHKSAIRALQDATTDEASRTKAQRALVMEFAALGLRDAARDILRLLHERNQDVPVSLEEFIRAERKPASKRKREQVQIIGGRYKVEELLGSGASGRVYRAIDQVRGRIVAIKLLAGSHTHGSEAYARFAREAKLATSLHHPNLVETYDVSAEQGYMVMEYMMGASLEDKIDETMSPASVRRLALDVLAGLELAHKRGIIHRDIKPANIFFDVRGTAKIGDFGVAHLLDMGQTQTGGLIGTLAYMSPEQITGAPLSIAADLYGLGVTIFQALCGRLPFLGPDFVAQHLGDTAPAPSKISDCDSHWDPILLKLLEKNPGDRYDSIETLRNALLALDFSEQVSALLLPRASVSDISEPHQTEGEGSDTEADDDESSEPQEKKERYQHETDLRETGHSRLSRAIDTNLNRTVIIERWNEVLDEESERRLFALARGGGPFLQRSLSYDRSQGVAIFEAPTGNILAERTEPLSTRLALRLFKRLARAVASLHNNDRSHGSINGNTVLLDERGHPTVLVCGLEVNPDTQPSPKEDANRIIEVVLAAIVGDVSDDAASTSDPDAQDDSNTGAPGEISPDNPDNRRIATLVTMILPDAPDRVKALAGMPVGDGEELYAFAEALELQLLEQKQSTNS
ncbi:MAG: protein kinase [Kofleriaceae bacterium]|nr:protein kinase [Kofleriaceae bacterium]